MEKFAQKYAKAIVAFFTATGAAAATVYADGSVETGEAIVAVCGVMVATFGVWLVPNK